MNPHFRFCWSHIAFLLLCATAVIASSGRTFTTLAHFQRPTGSFPWGVLIQATDGDFYGTTSTGGNGPGSVFKITSAGALTTLYNFCTLSGCLDGLDPYAGLVQATDGDFYGTTHNGGANDTCPIVPSGFTTCGTVFKITQSGTLTTLHSFSNTDGALPAFGSLVQATNGNFYGATEQGGAQGIGTVFTITPAGTLTTLHSFAGSDGGYPEGGLIQATDGDFYGTTYSGGSYNCGGTGTNGGGTVFKMTPAGNLTTIHSFSGPDGCNSYAALVQATNGNFYGTTYYGGANNVGTVFQITPSGTLTTLYSFDSAHGQWPIAGLVQATDGNFYGTTLEGGAAPGRKGSGTIFKITPKGTLTRLHSFSGTDSAYPYAGLTQATDGDFYGTTTNGYGTVFSLSVGIGPFVKVLPTSGTVGTAVSILGTNLTGATSVAFSGTTASFTLASPSLITTTVPTGATTGKVQVVTPTSTLLSNVVFRVR